MKHIHFLYGNQTFEIEQEVKALAKKLLPDVDLKEAVFTFDVEDFFSKDQNQNSFLLSEYKNTCETVSFFSPVILIYLKNLQSLVVNKKQKDPLGKDLENIVLIKKDHQGEREWFDADTLLDTPQTHYKLTGRQIVKKVTATGANSYLLTLDDDWNEKTVILQQGNKYHTVSIKVFLSQKLNGEIEFAENSPSGEWQVKGSNDLKSLLCGYLENPPPQVELVLSAHIRHTRELDQDIYALIKKNAVELKKTVSYDDNRPVSWVIDQARKKQLKLDSVSADLLIEIAGSDYAILDMELDKLSVLLSPGENVSPQVLLTSVSPSKNFTIFRISDALVKKDLKIALECLQMSSVIGSSDYVSVFALIAAQFRKVLKISWMTQQGLPEKLIIESLRMNQWIAKQLIKQVENFTTRELENLVIYLSKSDIQLKYSAKEAKTLLENICFLICQHEFRNPQTIKSRWLP